MGSANLVAEIHQKPWNKRALSTREPYTYEYVCLLQSFHRGTLSIHWYIAQKVKPSFFIFVLFRRSCKTAIISRSLYECILINFVIATISFILNVAGNLPEIYHYINGQKLIMTRRVLTSYKSKMSLIYMMQSKIKVHLFEISIKQIC